MNISELVGKVVEIDESYKGEFYYECENGGRYDYDVLERNNWKGKVVDVSGGRNVNIVVVVEGKYFEFEDIEILVDGESLDDVVNVWDWDNVVNDYDYSDESGLIESNDE